MATMSSSTGKYSFLVDSERATTSVARWLACSTPSTLLRMLDDPCFAMTLKEQVPARFPASKRTKLSQPRVKKHVGAEHQLMKRR